jgi:hypothetical protein
MNPSDALWQMPFMQQQAVEVSGDDTVYLAWYKVDRKVPAIHVDHHYPSWREARAELNELPLAAEVWNG